MEWYYGNGMNDFIVPEDQYLLDRHPSSPDNWSKWGINAPEGFNSPKNFVTMDSNATTEAEFDFIDESFNNEVQFESSTYDKDQCSSSSVSGVPQQSFQQTAFSCDQPNYQLQELSSFEQTDDIFLLTRTYLWFSKLYKHEPVIAGDSMLEDFPRVEKPHKSFYLYPENQCSNTPGGLRKDISASKFVPCNSNSNDCLNLEKVKILDPSEQYSGDDKQSSIEESTLEDLETIISKFNEKTRISFRDALYRLAENTKQRHLVEDLEGDLDMQQAMPWAVHNEALRSEDKQPMESETNSVDRAVADLMFNGTTYCVCS